MKEFDPQSLAEFNGQDGKPVYIAHQGRVYDVSGSELWRGGAHMKRHSAGKDLTNDIQAAPHTPEVLERYPQVGILKQTKAEDRPMPAVLARTLERFPFFRRHPHPMVVHFPIVFMISVTFFNLLYLLTGEQSFEIDALHCLGAAILFTPVAILTGFFTWWLNYLARPMRPVTIKIVFSTLLMIIALVVFFWRIHFPGILVTRGVSKFIYLLLVCSFFPLVSIVGWYGALLTFPLEKKDKSTIGPSPE